MLGTSQRCGNQPWRSYKHKHPYYRRKRERHIKIGRISYTRPDNAKENISGNRIARKWISQHSEV